MLGVVGIAGSVGAGSGARCAERRHHRLHL